MIKIVIPGEPRTKKNSQQIFINKRTGRPFISQSERYKQYEKECGWYLNRYSHLEVDYPVNVKCLFYMRTKRKVDLSNLIASISDILVKYHVLKDDNSKIIVSYDGSRVLYDKEFSRCEIEIKEIL